MPILKYTNPQTSVVVIIKCSLTHNITKKKVQEKKMFCRPLWSSGGLKKVVSVKTRILSWLAITTTTKQSFNSDVPTSFSRPQFNFEEIFVYDATRGRNCIESASTAKRRTRKISFRRLISTF